MKLIIKIIAVIGFIILIVVVIAFARGYRWNRHEKSLTATGILAINSIPRAAKVYINGELRGVTAVNITVDSGQYTVEIKKDGYTTWSKTLRVQGELVYTIDALLFPLNPSLSPLTNLGVVKIVAVDNLEKLIIFSDNQQPEKDGIYLFETNNGPLSLLPPLKLLLLKKKINDGLVDLKKTAVFFSPDYKEGIFEFSFLDGSSAAYLLSLDRENNNNLIDVTTSKDNLIQAWNEEKTNEILKIYETFPKDIAKIATDSFQLINFSPDKTKILYSSKTEIELPRVINPPLIASNQTPETRTLTKNHYYVYDKKEDKNYLLSNLDFLNKNTGDQFDNLTTDILWYPDSQRIVYYEDNKISIVDYDGSNNRILYSGPLEQSKFSITSDGKLIILANLNPKNNILPDLYLVGIR